MIAYYTSPQTAFVSFSGGKESYFFMDEVVTVKPGASSSTPLLPLPSKQAGSTPNPYPYTYSPPSKRGPCLNTLGPQA